MRNYIKEMLDDLRRMEDEKSMPRKSEEYNYDVLNDVIEKGRFNRDENRMVEWIAGSIILISIVIIVVMSIYGS